MRVKASLYYRQSPVSLNKFSTIQKYLTWNNDKKIVNASFFNKLENYNTENDRKSKDPLMVIIGGKKAVVLSASFPPQQRNTRLRTKDDEKLKHATYLFLFLLSSTFILNGISAPSLFTQEEGHKCFKI